MATFIGEYICKIDEKGRLMLPMAFKKQMPPEAKDTFVIKRDIYEPCLVLFSIDEWERQMALVRQKLNPYNREDMAFLRGLFKGTAEVTLDNANRLLIPKRLLQEVNIEKEAVLAGQDGKIEMWARNTYEQIATGEDFARLAQKIMGNLTDKS